MKLNHLINVYKLLFLCIICSSCQEVPKNLNYSLPKHSQFEKWKSDSTGCLGFRNFKEANRIISFINSMNGKKEINIIRLLGKPNYQYKDEGLEEINHFRYYMNKPCDTLDKNFDLTYLEITQYKSMCSSSITSQ